MAWMTPIHNIRAGSVFEDKNMSATVVFVESVTDSGNITYTRFITESNMWIRGERLHEDIFVTRYRPLPEM